MAKIIATSGNLIGKVFDLTKEDIIIGRDGECGIPIKDNKASRQHACISYYDNTYYIRDLDSSNNTFVNEKSIGRKTVALTDADIIRTGNSEFRYSTSTATVAIFDDQDTIIQKMDTQHLPLLSPDEEKDSSGALRFLLDLAREAEKANNPEMLAAVLSSGLLSEVDADRAMLFIGKDHNMSPVEFDVPVPLKKIYGMPWSTTVLHQVAKEKVSILSRINDDERLKDAESIKHLKITSAICVPLLAGEELLGAIYLDQLDRKNEYFSSADLELASAAGLQCSMALLNIRRIEELRASRDRLEAELTGPKGFIGESKVLKNVYDFINRVAPTDAGVLILGESGTGKELVARAIHRQSPRSERPFVIVNCAALAESLAEAELFGHERGAFTGADRSRPGRFLAAEGGTIFLDEIGELSESIQAKLLRVLESGEIAPVGEAGVRNIDVRVVAATNRDLASEVEKGNFRRDLYYRLNIMCVDLPPLRNRIGDIPLLITHFVNFLGEKCGRPGLIPSQKLIDRCSRYPWPGNIRELRNAVERMVILCQSETLDIKDLPPEISGTGGVSLESGLGGLRSLENVEKEHITSVLKELEGNKKKAAEVLGIDRSTLYAKIKNYGI